MLSINLTYGIDIYYESRMQGALLSPSTDYISFLKDKLEERIQSNQLYSLRSFARDIGIAAPNLSLILRRKKNLSSTSAVKVASKLGLNDDECLLFCDLVSLQTSKSEISKRIIQSRILQKHGPSAAIKHQLGIDAFRTISDWYHFAILELTCTKKFKSDPLWIAKRLGISIHEVNTAIERLKRLGLITEKNRKLLRTDGVINTTDGVPSDAIKKFQNQILRKAADSLIYQKLEERDFIVTTIATNPQQLKKAEKILRKARDEISKTLSQGELKEVYCFSAQMFKLTKETP